MRTLSLFVFFLLLTSCQKPTPPKVSQEEKCELTNGKYLIQNMTLLKDTQQYEMVLLNAPSCLKMPINVKKLDLERIEEGSKEKAILKIQSGTAKAFIAQDFTIAVSQLDPKTNTTKEVGSWSPFIAGAAGAAAGSIISNVLADKLLNKKSDETPIKSSAPVRDVKQSPTQTPPPQKKNNFFKVKSKKPSVKIYKRRR